jgi:hypothetical protein
MTIRVQPATVIATVALFVALGGSSYAVVGGQINGGQLRDRSVPGTKLKRHTIGAGELNFARLPKVPASHLADHSTNALKATYAQSAVRADSAARADALTGKLSAAQVVGKLPTTQISGQLPATQISGKLPATQISGKLPATQISGNLPGSQVSGAVANATSAASVDGQSFSQINARAISPNSAPLLTGFGGLTLACSFTAGTPATVTLQITNPSSAAGTFSAGVISDGSAAAQLVQGTVAAASQGTPTTTPFTFPVTTGAQVNFSYKLPTSGHTQVVTGSFAIQVNNGCTAFGTAEAS